MTDDRRPRLGLVQNEPVGVFHAVTTRDHGERQRDGQPYFGRRYVTEDLREGAIYEILMGTVSGSWRPLPTSVSPGQIQQPHSNLATAQQPTRDH